MKTNRSAVAADPRADGALAGAAGSGKFVQWLDTARDLATPRGKAGPLARLAAARPLPAPAMAVLVQQLVEADAAGVAFTAHPITGDRSRVLVNAAWGLGQSIVDGEVEADTWLLDRETLAAVERTV